jgi:hypothetical protein
VAVTIGRPDPQETTMTRADFIGSKQRARAEECKQHGCCVIHSVKRTCGHTDRLHDSSSRAAGTNHRLQVWRSTRCEDCTGMAEQGIIILDNHPTFAAAL